VHGPFEKYAPQVGTAAGDEDSVATGVNMGDNRVIVLRLERVGAGVGVLGENELVECAVGHCDICVNTRCGPGRGF
jgi:hypothetical protein